MIVPNYEGIGFVLPTNAENGREQVKITNSAYLTPYQFPYKGMFVKTALSSAYDATATPTIAVAVPIGTAGEYVEGWNFITTYKMNPLPGAANELFPLTENCSATDGNSIAYAPSLADWTEVTVVPLIPGDIIGVPVASGANLIGGAEVSATVGGYARVAASNHYVVGKVELPANNLTGANGAKTATVRIFPPYKKA